MKKKKNNPLIVHGIEVDERTGCAHYRSSLDVVAILFKCCQKFYSCYQCHESLNDHKISLWRPEEYGIKAILCGECKELLSIQNYLEAGHQCIHCQAPFNPHCQRHYHHYFL